MNPIIQMQFDKYEAANAIEEENAAKEVIQEIALYGLWRANFFEVAVFQGGTSLRILHKLPRFSEDLDTSQLTMRYAIKISRPISPSKFMRFYAETM